MKASSAVTELRQFAIAYVLAGAVAISLTATNADRWSDDGQEGFTAVVTALVGLGIVAHVAWTLRAFRRAQPVPESVVVLTRWGTFWRRVVPGAGPTVTLAVYLPLLGGPWLLGALYLVFGAVVAVEAVVAARLERSSDVRLLRAETRYFLAH